jgi:hypothetical protein
LTLTALFFACPNPLGPCLVLRFLWTVRCVCGVCLQFLCGFLWISVLLSRSLRPAPGCVGPIGQTFPVIHAPCLCIGLILSSFLGPLGKGWLRAGGLALVSLEGFGVVFYWALVAFCLGNLSRKNLIIVLGRGSIFQASGPRSRCRNDPRNILGASGSDLKKSHARSLGLIW